MEPQFQLEIGTRSLSSLPNFRAVQLPGLRSPLLYRSGFIERLSADGVKELAERVRCVVDLRGQREMLRTLPRSHVTAAFRQRLLDKYGRVSAVPGASDPDDGDGDGSDRCRYTIDFLGYGFYLVAFLRLPAGDKLGVGWSMLTSLYSGDRSYLGKAAEIVIKPGGLSGQICNFADNCHRELAAVLRLLLQPGSLPCLLHCFLGKDRTGLIVLLLQWLADVPLEIMRNEYLLSQELTEEVRDEAIRYYADMRLPSSFAECHLEEFEAIMQHVSAKYGGIQQYMAAVGLTDAEIQRLRATFSGN